VVSRGVRDHEFEDEIGALNIQGATYKDAQNKDRPMFILTLSQSRQALVRESKVVRKAVITYIEKLESKQSVPDYVSALRLYADQLEANQRLTAAVSEQQILLDTHDEWWSVMRYNLTFGKGWDHRKKCSTIGKQMTAISKSNGITPVRTKDSLFGWVNTYPVDMWKKWECVYVNEVDRRM